MKGIRGHSLRAVVVALAALMALASACAPAQTVTPTPTKAAATTAAAPATAAPKVVATAPAAAPAATSTVAPPKVGTGPAIKVGVLLPLSGAQAPIGVTHRIAVQLAEADVNASGGINGAPFQLIIDDSPFDPRQAVTLVRKQAEQDKVFAIVGPFSSGEFDSAAALTKDLKLVVISQALTAGIAAKNRPYAFQTNLPDEVSTPPAIDAYKKKYPNVKSVVLTGDTKQSVTQYEVVELFPKLLKDKGLTIINTVPWDFGTTDFSAIVTKIKGMNPDGIVLAATPADGAGIAKELERQGVKAPVVTSAAITGGPFVESAGTSVEGWILPSVMDFENPDPAVQSFVTRFFKAAEAEPLVKPKPGHVGSEGIYYDMVMMTADIMRKAGVKPDTALQEARDKIRDGFQNLKGYKGVDGVMNMLPSGDTERQPQPPQIVEKGKWKTIR